MDLGLCEVEREDICHLNAWSNETKSLVLPARTLANGVNIRMACAQILLDDDSTASVSTFDTSFPCELISSSNSNGKADSGAIHSLAILKNDSLDRVVLSDLNLAHSLGEHDLQSQGADLLYNKSTSITIKLSAEYPSIPLNKLNFLESIEIHHRFRSFKTEQPTT